MNGWPSLHTALAAEGLIAFPLALLGGVVMGFNPCCLAFYPAVAATCCAGSAYERSRIALPSALAFVAGTAGATTLLGLLAAAAGHALGGLGPWPRYAIAIVPLLMGTHLLGWLRLPLPPPLLAWRGGGAAAAFVTGLLLSLVFGSCGTPVLAAILSYAAARGNLGFAGALLFLYGVGNGLPLLLVGTGAGELARQATRSESRRRWVERLAGALLVGLGFYLILTAP